MGPPELPPEILSREAFVLEFGPRCAAWMLWNRRRVLRTRGEASWCLSTEDIMPEWFSLGFEYLGKHRTRKWMTRTWISGGVRYFHVRRRPIPCYLFLGGGN